MKLLRLWGVLAALAAGTACGTDPGAATCAHTALAAAPMSVPDPKAPVTFTATFTSEGKPVPGVEVLFFSKAVADSGRPAGGIRFGSATTDVQGVATHVEHGGTDAIVSDDERMTGYDAEFSSLTKINDVQYCRARAEAEIK